MQHVIHTTAVKSSCADILPCERALSVHRPSTPFTGKNHSLQPGHSCLARSSCVSMPGTLPCASYTSLPVQPNYPQDMPSYRSKITIALPCSWITSPALHVSLGIQPILLVSVPREPLPHPVNGFSKAWGFVTLLIQQGTPYTRSLKAYC